MHKLPRPTSEADWVWLSGSKLMLKSGEAGEKMKMANNLSVEKLSYNILQPPWALNGLWALNPPVNSTFTDTTSKQKLDKLWAISSEPAWKYQPEGRPEPPLTARTATTHTGPSCFL